MCLACFTWGCSKELFNNLAFIRGDDLKGDDAEGATCFIGVLCARGTVSKVRELEDKVHEVPGSLDDRLISLTMQS